MVVNPLINRIYVANQSDNSVSVIDGASGNVIATVPTGRLPYALDLNLLNNKIYVANQSDGSVTVIDGTGDTVSATVPTGIPPLRGRGESRHESGLRLERRQRERDGNHVWGRNSQFR